ncbi:MAG: DNA-processing protein DprA [Prevotella sp.]
MDQQEIFNTLILTRISYFNLSPMLELYRKTGSATAIVEHRDHLQELQPDLTPEGACHIQGLFGDFDAVCRRVEEEMAWMEANGVRALTLLDADYPQRLKDCPDAPLALFYRGTADLNKSHVVSIVGTRHITVYGQDVIRRIMKELQSLLPDTLIVSGLAYGVDINAHRQALDNGMETVGVLAHGLDYLYPPRHLDTAKKMLLQGGLLTEFMTHTNADKMNFVRRNRITAGIADAVVLIESAAHGGGLITARIANSYGREVLAVPGPLTAPYSEGCNNLIRDNGATLLTSAEDILHVCRWENDRKVTEARKQGIPRELFPQLSPDEMKIVNFLKRQNDQQKNIIALSTGLGIAAVSSLLFQLEMKGVVKFGAGDIYHLL